MIAVGTLWSVLGIVRVKRHHEFGYEYLFLGIFVILVWGYRLIAAVRDQKSFGGINY
jgi:hypothetical protein